MEYIIYVGTLLRIKRGFLKKTIKIQYCGMSNENTFVVSSFITEGYQGFSSNVYYKADTNTIQILDKQFDVIEVTPEYIVLGD